MNRSVARALRNRRLLEERRRAPGSRAVGAFASVFRASSRRRRHDARVGGDPSQVVNVFVPRRSRTYPRRVHDVRHRRRGHGGLRPRVASDRGPGRLRAPPRGRACARKKLEVRSRLRSRRLYRTRGRLGRLDGPAGGARRARELVYPARPHARRVAPSMNAMIVARGQPARLRGLGGRRAGLGLGGRRARTTRRAPRDAFPLADQRGPSPLERRVRRGGAGRGDPAPPRPQRPRQRRCRRRATCRSGVASASASSTATSGRRCGART